METIETNRLKPNPSNPREIEQVKLEKLMQSIVNFPEMLKIRPLVVNDQLEVLGGNMRLKALQKLGIKEATIIRADKLTESQQKEFIIKDNTTAGKWDYETLANEFDLAELAEWGMEIDDLLNDEPITDIDPDDEAPETPEEESTKVAAGQIWELKSADGLRTHKLLIGDSTDSKKINEMMGSDKASLVFTDPPYGVNYESSSQGKLKNDDKKEDDLIQSLLAPALKAAAANSEATAAFYIWHASSTRKEFEWALAAAGLEEKQYIIWVKPSLVLGRADYHWQHEPCFYCQKQGKRATWVGDRKQTTTWELQNLRGGETIAIETGVKISNGAGNQLFIQKNAPKNKKLRTFRIAPGAEISLTPSITTSDAWRIHTDPASEYIHPTQKPTGLARRAIANHLEKGQIVYDPFAGSGSTLIAAELEQTQCRTTELDPKFAARIIDRFLATFAGSTAAPKA